MLGFGDEAPVSDGAVPRHCGTCPVLQGGFCSGVDRRVLARLAERAAPIRQDSDRTLHDGDAETDFVGVLVGGYLRTAHYSQDGTRRLLNLYMPGDLIGPRGDGRDDVVIETATDVKVCRFDGATFRRAFDGDASLRDLVYEQIRGRTDRLRRLALSLGSARPEGRLLGFLAAATHYMPWERLPSGGGILTMVLPRRDIADLLGTTVESISRITQHLGRRGVIRILDPYHFELPAPQCLERLAEHPGASCASRPGRPDDVPAPHAGDAAARNDRRQ